MLQKVTDSCNVVTVMEIVIPSEMAICQSTWLASPYLLQAAESLLRSHPVLSYPLNTPHCLETGGSSPCSQQPDTCSYSEPDQSTTCPHLFHFHKIYRNVFLYQNSRLFPSLSSYQMISASKRHINVCHNNRPTIQTG